MARNKRNIVRNSTGVEIKADSPFSVLDSECKRIVNESKHGNCLTALNLIKDLCLKYENSRHEAFLNRMKGKVFLNVAFRSNDLKDKNRYYENAVKSVKRAVDLSPNAIEFALFYANLLFGAANEGWEYEKVVRECERALAIEDAVDPLMESRQDQCNEIQDRVFYVKDQLRLLIQKANVALVSSWKRNLGNEVGKFEFMPVRRSVYDETVEVRRSSGIRKVPVVGSLERAKQGNACRSVLSDEMMEWVRPYWSSMSLDRKKDFLKVKIADLQEHIMSLKDQLQSNLIVEALSFCKEKKKWHFMICCLCNKKISDIEAFRKHIERVHLESMPLELLSVFPKQVENDWVEMIRDGCWEPLDLNAAARVLEERPLDFVDKESLLRENWPVAQGSQRAELLDEIQAILESHVKLQCLSESHIISMSKYAVTALQNHPQLLRLNVHETHLCICFLGAQELLNILKVLQEIADSCERNMYSGLNTADIDDSNNLAQDAFMEQIAFSQEDSVVVSIYDCSSDNSPETDALLISIYADSLNPEELPSCPPFEYAQQGLQIIQQLGSDFMRLKALIVEKLDLLIYRDTLTSVGYLCDVARTKIKSETDFQCQTPLYESVLRNMEEELTKTRTTVSDVRFELKAIRCVLDEVESLGSDEVDYSRVRETIRIQEQKTDMEIKKMDARIMSIRAKRMHLLQEHARASKHDFRTIIIPLLKSFLRARLEDLKKKGADELILDTKSSVGSGVDNLKLVPERKKDKKKSKKSRNNSGPKVINNDKSLGRTAEEILLPGDHDEKCPSTEIDASGTCADTDHRDSQLREENYKKKLELEADERKLEEALEKQRQMEYEAKQKSLISQHVVRLKAIGPEPTEIVSDGEQLAVTLENQRQTVDNLKLVAERKKDGKKKKKRRNNSRPKVANNYKSLVKTAEEILLPDDHHGKCPSTENAASGTYADTDHHDSQLREEDCENKWELEAGEASENQRQMEYEAKQKSVISQREVSLTAIGQEQTEITAEGEQIEDTLGDQLQTKDGAIQKHPVEHHREKDETHHILVGAEDNTTDECMLNIGSIKLRVNWTDREQQPMPRKAHRHGIERPTIGQHSLADRNIPHKKHPETCDSRNEVMIKVNVMDVHERGLTIVLVEHNSFPNVIIQSLWHVRFFQEELEQRLLTHAHVGDSFLVCAWCDLLGAPTTEEREANPLRVALREMLSCFSNKGPLNDVSEVLETILLHLHQVSTHSPCVSVTESVDSSHHRFNMFKLDVFERMDCYHCGLRSRYRKHTSFFRKINASDLVKAKLMRPKYSFDELINLVGMNHHLACDPAVSGCGALNHIEHDLTTSPHVFTAFLEWRNDSESVEDIAQTVEALSLYIDLRLLYRGLNTINRHCLVSMICYFEQHYCCFGFNEDRNWILHDEKTRKVIGGWDDVITMCKKEHMKPNVLFYEAVYWL